MFILSKNGLYKKLIILLIIFVGIGLNSNALAGKADNSIVFGQSTAVTDLGPAYGAFLMYPGGYEASFAIYDRLVTFDENLNIKPQLATSWSVSEDQKVITFKLREGVKFHDGSDFNAEAVKFNVERMMDEKINTTNRPLWDPIAGSDVIDEYTVTINTKETVCDFIEYPGAWIRRYRQPGCNKNERARQHDFATSWRRAIHVGFF